jgi:hypothetical protein
VRSLVAGVLAAETVDAVVVVLEGDVTGRRRLDVSVGVGGGLVAAVETRSAAESVAVAAGGPGQEYVRLQAVTREAGGEREGDSHPLAAVSFAAPVCAGSVSLVVEHDHGLERAASPGERVSLVAE